MATTLTKREDVNLCSVIAGIVSGQQAAVSANKTGDPKAALLLSV
jgi:hypothetical protein